jgi:F0F1-type ATP synthase membrane subunit b/b'
LTEVEALSQAFEQKRLKLRNKESKLKKKHEEIVNNAKKEKEQIEKEKVKNKRHEQLISSQLEKV